MKVKTMHCMHHRANFSFSVNSRVRKAEVRSMSDLFSLASIFMFQIGSRFLNIEFTEKQKYVIMHPVTQNIIVFSMFFVATQNFKVAFFLWALYFAFTRIFLNENHRYNLLPRSWVNEERGIEGLGNPNPTHLYYENLKMLPQ